MSEPIIPEVRPRRTGLWVAVAVTAIAVPVLVIDNLPGDEGSDPSTTIQVVTPVTVSGDRPDSGPPKGFSVVTPSTTTSTLPITTTSTTLAS